MVLSIAREYSPHSSMRKPERGDPKTELVGRFTELFGDLESQCGPYGKKLLEKLCNREIDMAAFLQELKELPDFRKFQETGLKYLEQVGIVERSGGQIIVDTDKIQTPAYVVLHPNLKTHDKYRSYKRNTIRNSTLLKEKKYVVPDLDTLMEDIWKMKEFQPFLGENWHDFLFNVFYHQNVISKQDMLQAQQEDMDPVAKPLFYNPESKADAFDIEKIRAADFHMGSWEVAGPVSASYSPELAADFTQVSLAAALYHPRYGAGERDETGKLLVTYKNGNRNVITNEWLRTSSGYGKDQRNLLGKGGLYASTQSALQSPEYSDLATMLKPDDFRLMSTSESVDMLGLKKELTHRSALVTLKDKIRYTLGDRYGMNKKTGKNVRADGGPRYAVSLLNNTHAGIWEVADDKTEKLVASFKLLRPDNPKLRYVQLNPGGYYASSASDIQIIPHADTQDRSQTDQVDDYQSIEKTKKEISKQTGISLQSLSLEEIKACVRYYLSISPSEQQKMLSFIKRYRTDGLKTFMVMQAGPNAVEALYAIDEKYETASASAIFKSFEALSKRAQNIDEDLQKFFSKSDGPINTATRLQSATEILNKAANLLQKFAQSKHAQDYLEILAELQKADTELQVFGAIFKSAVSPDSGLSFEDVRGMQYAHANKLTRAQQRDVEAMIEKNYAGSPLLPGVLSGFRKSIGNFDNAYDILTLNGRVVSFARFEKKYDTAGDFTGNFEFASFNTDPSLQRSGIGNTMMKRTLDLKASEKGVVISAETDPFSPICQFYIEKAGFVATGLQEYKNTGQYVFSIERNDHKTRPTSTDWKLLGGKTEVIRGCRELLKGGNVIVGFHEKDGKYFAAAAKKK